MTHMPTRKIIIDDSLRRRFWDKVEKLGAEDCWPWAGATVKGYGSISGTSSVQRYYSHRVSWEIHNGKIPHGMLVLHHCDNPPCVNPDHLYIGTAQDNSNDIRSRGKHPFSGFRGEEMHAAKLTNAAVVGIWEMLMDGRTHKEAADAHEISETTVREISHGRRWGHITESLSHVRNPV